MKKKKTISAALATALALTCMGSGGGTAFAVPLSDADLQTLASQIQQINDTSDSATASETPSAQADAVEGWTIDSNIAQGDEILEMANGWLHLKSTASNGNAAANPSSSNNWPAVAVWGTEGDMRMMLLLWDATLGNRSLKIVEIPVKTAPRALNNPDFPEK